MQSIEAALLDVDGTLVDSNDAHASAWVQALKEFGHRVPFSDVRRSIGKGADKLLLELVGLGKNSRSAKAISARRTELFLEDHLPGLRPFPMARELLQHMRGRGLRLTVATSANEQEMSALLDVVGAEGLLHERTSASDAESSKPDPDIVQAALHKAEVDPARALLLGDTPYDIEAASAAGVRTVALRSGGWQDSELAGAIAIYNDAADLLGHYDQSPFAAVEGG